MRKEEKEHKKRTGEWAPDELSEVWQELLGHKDASSSHPAGQEAPVPVLTSDPWNALTHSQGIEEVDLQSVDLHVSDQEVEQMLQVMQEQEKPASPERDPKKKL